MNLVNRTNSLSASFLIITLFILMGVSFHSDNTGIFNFISGQIEPMVDSETTSSSYSTVNGTYSDVDTGFEIQLPAGWSGFKTGSMVMAGPGGMDSDIFGAPVSKDPRDAVIMRLISQEKSAYVTTSEDALKMYPQQLGPSCGNPEIISSYMNVNGVNVNKVLVSCPGGGGVVIYDFANENNVISLRFEGKEALSDYNTPKIEKSIQTLKVNYPVDIKVLNDQIASGDLK